MQTSGSDDGPHTDTPINEPPRTGQETVSANEVLSGLPPPLRDAIRQQADGNDEVLSVVAAVAAYAGPLPPPGQLKGYEEVLPGSADRILKMAEEQARHRQYLEKTTIDGDRKRSWWGLWLGFAISLVDLGLGAGAVYTGHAAAGAVIMGIDVVGLAAVFVYGRREQRRERESKDAQSQVPQLPVSK